MRQVSVLWVLPSNFGSESCESVAAVVVNGDGGYFWSQ